VPVLWVDSIKCMGANGVQKILECGPGKVLSGLTRRIEPDISCFASEAPEGLMSAIAELSS